MKGGLILIEHRHVHLAPSAPTSRCIEPSSSSNSALKQVMSGWRVTRPERIEILEWRREQARTGISANRLRHWPFVRGGCGGRVRPLVPSHVHHWLRLASQFNRAGTAIRAHRRGDHTVTTRTLAERDRKGRVRGDRPEPRTRKSRT
jgi:hypothetical protein